MKIEIRTLLLTNKVRTGIFAFLKVKVTGTWNSRGESIESEYENKMEYHRALKFGHI